MMETTMINLAVLLMLSNLCHSPVTRPHLGGCFLALAAGGVHKHTCGLMNEYQSPTFSSFRWVAPSLFASHRWLHLHLTPSKFLTAVNLAHGPELYLDPAASGALSLQTLRWGARLLCFQMRVLEGSSLFSTHSQHHHPHMYPNLKLQSTVLRAVRPVHGLATYLDPVAKQALWFCHPVHIPETRQTMSWWVRHCATDWILMERLVNFCSQGFKHEQNDSHVLRGA
jgi:hypothetical protein